MVILLVAVVVVIGAVLYFSISFPPFVLYILLAFGWVTTSIALIQKEKAAEDSLAKLKAKVNTADEYRSKRVDEANEYYYSRRAEADQYYEGKRNQADEYYNSRRAESAQIEQNSVEAKAELQKLQKELSPMEANIKQYEGVSSKDLMLQIKALQDRQKAALPIFGRLDKKRQAYRCFNAECEEIFSKLNESNLESAKTKIINTCININKIFSTDGIAISQQYLDLKCEEVELAYAYKVQREKELLSKITSDAETQADKIITSAKLNAEKESSKIISEARKTAREILDNSDNEAENIIRDARATAESLKSEADSLSLEKSMLEQQISQLEAESVELQKPLEPYTIGIDPYENMKSDEIKNQISVLQGHEREMVNDGSALDELVQLTPLSFNKKRQMLLCFNTQCARVFDNLTIANSDTARAKIQRSYESVNRIFASDGLQISEEYLQAKFEELHLMYAYAVKIREERETQKAIREQLQEEAKVQREIELENAKIDKELKHHNIQISRLMKHMHDSKNDVEKQLYVERIRELEEEVKKLRADKEHVLERENNTRSGYVYIISNIGSFGEDVYKIGMTRRLEPQDRIDELSSASVPFKFDVHAMIFSDDAPALENILHQTFADMQVNRVNPRKEFFRVDLNKIKKVVKENFDGTAVFTDVPEAEEYRETLRLLVNNSDDDTYKEPMPPLPSVPENYVQGSLFL